MKESECERIWDPPIGYCITFFSSPISVSRNPRASENLVLSVWETSSLRSGSPEPIRRCLLPLASVVVCGAMWGGGLEEGWWIGMGFSPSG